MNQHTLRHSTFQELLERNVHKPKNIEKIKRNLKEILSIIINGYGYEGIESYCSMTEKYIISRTIYYDYLFLIDIVLRDLAEKVCQEKLDELKKTTQIKLGFDASWSHRRNGQHCLGILMDLKTNFIICFHLVHHGKEQAASLSSTEKHSKNMEGISLNHIIERTQIDSLSNLTFIHDCDLTDHKLISEKLPLAKIKFDTNHLCKKTKKIINQICMNDQDLKNLNELIQNFFSILLHDKNFNNEEKLQKWESMPNYFIEHEDLDPEYNAKALKTLDELISDISDTFSKVDPEYTTNPIESFNHSRASIASKNTAFRISWRIRAYVSIIKWNVPYWKKAIFDSFQLTLPNHVMLHEKALVETKRKKATTTKTDAYKKKRAIKRKIKANKYKVSSKDKMVHNYADDMLEDISSMDVRNKRRKGKFSPVQQLIIDAISALATEDKPFVPYNKIMKYITTYFDTSKYARPQFVIRSQVTRLVNMNILIQKRFSFKLV